MEPTRPQLDWMSALDVMQSEARISRVRAFIFSGFAVACGLAYLFGAIPGISVTAFLACISVGILASLAAIRHADRRRSRPLHWYAGNTIDISLITGIIAVGVITGARDAGALGPAHLAYFAFVILAATRFHVASTLYAAVLAALQYAAVCAWIANAHPNDLAASAPDNLLTPAAVAIRVLLILLTGGLAALFVRRVHDAGRAMQETQKLHARVVNEISDGLIVCRENGRIVDANTAASELLGVPRSVLVDLDAASVLPDPLWSILQNRWPMVLADGAASAESVRITRERGLARFVDVDARRLRMQEGTLVRIVLRDVTAEQSLWEKDSHYARLASLRKLASTLSHDFNNVLSSIEASAFIIDEALPVDAPEHEEVAIIRSSTARAASLVREIADLTDTRRPDLTPVDVADLIDLALHQAKPAAEVPVIVSVTVSPDVQNIFGDAPQLVRAIAKVIASGYAAMLDGGNLTLTAGNLTVKARQPELSAGDYVALEITDTGIGMPADMIEHVFDPLATGDGRRWTGFALASAHAIVARHGGSIGIKSTIGKGTTCTLTLPATRRELISDVVPQTSPDGASKRARLLVVDDDPGSRRSLARVLSTRGYDVRLAEDGRKALDICDVEEGSFDLVLLDMVMPGLSGKDVLAALRSRFPSMKVLVVTGDANESLRNEVMELGAAAVTYKPFDVLQLFDQVRSLTSSH